MSAMTADAEGRERGVTRPGYPPRVGLTGAVGAGKSSVARRLAARGALVLDADALARRATDDPTVLARIATELDESLLVEGRLDRAATARRVFAEPAARRALEAIVHPWVRAAAAEAEAVARAAESPPPLVVHDVPLLFETGLDAGMDATIVVVAPFATRLRRLAARSGWDEAAVRVRDAAQLDPEEKARRATFVVRNDGDEASLEEALEALWPRLVGLARRP